jgi:hypothetical protein
LNARIHEQINSIFGSRIGGQSHGRIDSAAAEGNCRDDGSQAFHLARLPGIKLQNTLEQL